MCELNETLIADDIDCIEAEWIQKASFGSMIWVEKGYKGERYSYDINSAFSAIIANQKFMFPIKKGIFRKITELEFQNMKYFEYGMY